MSLGAATFSFVKLRWAMAGCNWCHVLHANCGFQLAGMTFAGACLEHHKWRWRTLRYPNQRAYSVAIASVCVCACGCVRVCLCRFAFFCCAAPTCWAAGCCVLKFTKHLCSKTLLSFGSSTVKVDMKYRPASNLIVLRHLGQQYDPHDRIGTAQNF